MGITHTFRGAKDHQAWRFGDILIFGENKASEASLKIMFIAHRPHGAFSSLNLSGFTGIRSGNSNGDVVGYRSPNEWTRIEKAP